MRASFLPVFLIHRASQDVDRAVRSLTAREPTIDMHADAHVRITLWAVTQPDDVAEVEAALDGLDALYVADGHHRAAAASRYAAAQAGAGGSGHLASVLFPSDQLVVHAYNRCVTDLGGRAPDEVLAAIEAAMRVEPVATGDDPRPRRAGEMAMLLDGRWHRIAVPDEVTSARGIAGLDVTALHGTILEPLFGIGDPRSDPRIEFVPGTLGIEELERMCDAGYAAAFALHPMAVDDLMDVADRGELMPPKSTWFAPKLRSGLVVRLL